MANWWDDAPLVEQSSSQQDEWWKDAPIVGPGDQPPPALPPTGGARQQFNYDPDGALGGLRTAAGGFLEGVPVVGPYLRGAAEHVTAAGASLVNGQPYDQALARVRSLGQAEKEANPYVDTGAQIAGNIAGTAPLIAAAPAAFGVTGSSVPARMVAGGLSGSALGAADGAVRDGTDGAIANGLLGGGFGAAGPLAGNLIGRGVEAFQGARANQAAARAAGTSRDAVDVVSRGLAADNATGGADNILRAGQAGMLADAGPASQSMLDTAIQRAGPGAGRATQRIEARSVAARDDINAALSQALGEPQAVGATERNLRTSTAAARKQTYDTAYATPIDYSNPVAREIEDIVANRVPGSAIRAANELMRTEGVTSGQILADIAEDGTVTFRQLPDVRQLDYITRGLNEVADQANGQGSIGGTTQIGNAYSNLSRDIRGRLRTLVPEYGTALDTAAEPIAARNALRFGQQLLSAGTTRDDAAQFVQGLSAPELNALRQGVRAQIDEALANVRRTVSDPNVDARQGIAALRDLSSDAAREKLALLLPPEQVNSLFREIDRAGQSYALRGSIATNTRTYGRIAAERSVKDRTSPGIIDNAANWSPQGTLQAVSRALLNTGPETTLAREDRLWGEIANLLTQPANVSQGQLRQALEGAALARPRIANNAALADLLISGGIAGGLAPPARTLFGNR